jgi:hypothetical protein
MQQSQRDRETPTPPYRHPAFGPRKVRRPAKQPAKPKPVEPKPVQVAVVEVVPKPEPVWEPRIVLNSMHPMKDTEFWRPIAIRAAAVLKAPMASDAFFRGVRKVIVSTRFSFSLNAMAAAEALGYARHDARTGMWRRTGFGL